MYNDSCIHFTLDSLQDLQVCDYPYRVQCDGVPSNPPPTPPAPETSTVPEGETTYNPIQPGPPAPPAPPAEPALLPAVPSEPTPGPEAPPAAAPPAVASGPEAYYSLKKVPASECQSSYSYSWYSNLLFTCSKDSLRQFFKDKLWTVQTLLNCWGSSN